MNTKLLIAAGIFITSTSAKATDANIYGRDSESVLGQTKLTCNPSHFCDATTPWVIPSGTAIGILTLDHAAYVKIAENVKIEEIVINGGSTLEANAALTLKKLSVNDGTVTSQGFTGSWTNQTWLPSPAPGNGQLLIDASDFATIGVKGLITMNAKGFVGGEPGGQGASPLGPGALAVTTANGGGSGGSKSLNKAAGGASYGTSGTKGKDGNNGSTDIGIPYGKNDFSSQLYLGSGGGGVLNFNGYGAAIDSNSGGIGGGAIKIVTDSLTNAGTISADGGPGQKFFAGGGSGGTIILDAGVFKNLPTGRLHGKGGKGGRGSSKWFGGDGGAGRVGISTSREMKNAGKIIPAVVCTKIGKKSQCKS